MVEEIGEVGLKGGEGLVKKLKWWWWRRLVRWVLWVEEIHGFVVKKLRDEMGKGEGFWGVLYEARRFNIGL